ncbi:hypothetical protein BSQ44_15520 [Aquibium oceanicum]|uniref:Uncharacterized protein n=1 Tax=Aquibium oceanicum TaxID=1670800 RepID=A0A1L3ST80_9HYPH|nr:hypothetical protein BSQ44_15520 [Aquibium oceanicum]
MAESLTGLERCVQNILLRFAATTQNYLWAMNADGKILIAVEEIAEFDGIPNTRGYPRRRGHRHPSEDQKLGHPTLVQGGEVRIAGELALDEYGDGVRWVLNANSGRYCRQKPPRKEQVDAVVELFRESGLDVEVDYL